MRDNWYRNSEGYYDPTAGAALSSIKREEKKVKKQAMTLEEKKEKYRPLVFICSPFAGEVYRNVHAARDYCAFAVREGCIPFAPHLFFPQFMNDVSESQRNLGILFGKVFMDKCSEVWVFGKEISVGMELELEYATERNYKVRYFDEYCSEVSKNYAVNRFMKKNEKMKKNEEKSGDADDTLF